jgi:hypothetical protein
MKIIDYVFAAFTFCIAVTNYSNPFVINPLYLFACGYAIVRATWVVNITTIIVLLAYFKTIEWMLLGTVLPLGNYVIYPVWFAIDLLVYFCLIYRAPAMRRFYPRRASEFCITNADTVLGGIHLLYCFIGLLAFLEHCLRHLDDFGFDANNSTVIWLYENARVVYGIYPFLKTLLNYVELLAIFSTLGRYMQSPNVLKA